MATKKSSQLFQVGDRVKIRHTDWRGRIVEFRGPLGPGGMLVYRDGAASAYATGGQVRSDEGDVEQPRRGESGRRREDDDRR